MLGRTDQKMSSRLKKEIGHLIKSPPEGIIFYANSENINIFSVSIIGPHSSPYEGFLFEIEVEIPQKYPMSPPRINFKSPVYHPNIDTQGRICMDLLKQGWRPTITLESLLVAIQSLLSDPNPDDPLMLDIAEEYKFDRKKFERKARNMCREKNCQNFD